MKRSLHMCSLTLRHIGHTRINNGFFKLVEALLCIDWLVRLFTKYKRRWLTAISMSLSRCIPARMCAFSSLMQQNACYCKIKWTFAGFLPWYCYAIKTNRRTIHSRLSQPTSAGKGGDMSELQAHHCMTL